MAKKQSKPTIPSSSSSRTLPTPFAPVTNESLQKFLSQLPKEQVHLTHMDLNPIPLKRNIFIVPVLLNLAFFALLAWRAYSILPWYFQSLQNLYYLQRDTGSILGHGGWKLVKREAWMAVNFAVDYLLVRVVLPWPVTFFFDPAGSPVAWRLGGVHAREVIVRGSRSWTAEDLLAGEKRGNQSPFWLTRVLPYTSLENISKTGYLLMDANWDLEFGVMRRTQKMLINEEVKEEEINGKLWAWWPPKADDASGQWVVWDFRAELYMKDTDAPARENVEEGRRMVEKFRAKLEAMGKDELFWRWVDMIHYESTRPGGFTKERQEEAGQKVRKLFQDHGVDWDKFEQDVGIEGGQLVG